MFNFAYELLRNPKEAKRVISETREYGLEGRPSLPPNCAPDVPGECEFGGGGCQVQIPQGFLRGRKERRLGSWNSVFIKRVIEELPRMVVSMGCNICAPRGGGWSWRTGSLKIDFQL